MYDLMQSEMDGESERCFWKDMQTIAYKFAKQKIDKPQIEYYY